MTGVWTTTRRALPTAVAVGAVSACALLGSGPRSEDLVGTWSGEVRGSFGDASATFRLEEDLTFSAGGHGLYCAIRGTWSVEGDVFRGAGVDCDGSAVTPEAPADDERLAGSWTSSSAGNAGTFDITREGD